MSRGAAVLHSNPIPSLDAHRHLLSTGLLTPAQLAIIQEEQRQQALPLRAVILKTGFVSEECFLQWTQDQFGYGRFTPRQNLEGAYALCSGAVQQALYDLKAIPLHLDVSTGVLRVALADVLDIAVQDAVMALYTNAVKLEILGALEKEIFATLDHLYAASADMPGARESVMQSPYIASPESSDATTTIDQILDAAVKAHASDVHFAPEDLFVRVHFRVNGSLQEHRLLHINQWPMVLSRLKILSTMNIAETRLPQTGRFSAYLSGRHIDFRASVHPTARGESFVVRLLDRIHTFYELADLGFADAHVAQIKEHLKQPYGLIIMTGPTGSGKTTTLYSMIAHLNTTHRNIMTLEDPIEYEMHTVRQTQVQPEIGFDFAQGVRSLLRQDPDVILIGEIRDEATARMALRAAMTGHLVLTTLHTHSALSAVNRLIDLGIEDALLSGQINCILSQRLVKQKTQDRRRPLLEVLTITPELDAMLVKRTPYHDVLAVAQRQGFETMQDQARDLIAQGELTVDDVQRVLAFQPTPAKR